MITDPVAVLVVLAAVVYGAVVLEERYHGARSLGAAFLGIMGGMLLSNAGVLPGESATYRFLVGPGVSVGIALILFSVDVRTVMQAGPRMVGAFGIGAVGTAAGAIAGGLMWSGLVGPETWKLSGQFAGTYTGGGVNFAALGEAFETSGDLFTAGIAADVIITAVWMAACLAAPVLLGRWNPEAGAAGSTSTPTGDGHPERSDGLHRTLYASARSMKLTDVAALVVLGIGTVWGAGRLGGLLPGVPQVLWLTTLALLLAQVPAVKRLTGAAVVGNYLVLLFLASNGARSVIANIFEVGPGVFYFAMTTVAVHGVVIFVVGRLAGLDFGTLAVASQANVGGAGSAIAMATARGYRDRLLPGVAVGLFGYALGNYWGYFIGQLARSLLGG
ncbi:MAG: DUF819 family protein [Gemmatimonadota bacterium]